MIRHISRRSLAKSFIAISATSLGLARPAGAVALAKPEGKVVLTITGRIKETNGEGAAEFDIAMLEALGMKSFTTTTPWYSGPVTFEGVPMAALLDRVGASGESITARALNDYSTDIPIEDFRKYNVLLALKRDGAYMPVKDKGPLFIVYPYDSDTELKHQRFYSRSAWQVARIIVK
jgi:hypothetical protein